MRRLVVGAPFRLADASPWRLLAPSVRWLAVPARVLAVPARVRPATSPFWLAFAPPPRRSGSPTHGSSVGLAPHRSSDALACRSGPPRAVSHGNDGALKLLRCGDVPPRRSARSATRQRPNPSMATRATHCDALAAAQWPRGDHWRIEGGTCVPSVGSGACGVSGAQRAATDRPGGPVRARHGGANGRIAVFASMPSALKSVRDFRARRSGGIRATEFSTAGCAPLAPRAPEVTRLDPSVCVDPPPLCVPCGGVSGSVVGGPARWAEAPLAGVSARAKSLSTSSKSPIPSAHDSEGCRSPPGSRPSRRRPRRTAARR